MAAGVKSMMILEKKQHSDRCTVTKKLDAIHISEIIHLLHQYYINYPSKWYWGIFTPKIA